MAKDFSFDIISDYDVAELTNAIDQAGREIAIRYDFKGTPANIELGADKTTVEIKGDSQYQLDALLELLRQKLIKRGLSINLLDSSNTPVQGGKEMRWTIKLQKGLDQEKAKKVTGLIRTSYPKVKTQIQGDIVRAVSASKDDLQAVMMLLKQQDFGFPLQFENYR